MQNTAIPPKSASTAPGSVPVNAAAPEGYVILGIYPAGSAGASPMAAAGKVVLFDTVAMAQQFVPLLGMGRTTTWSSDGETAFWPDLASGGINRVDILTGYDPFNVPVGFPGGVRSEAKGRDWKKHVMWSHAFYDCGQWEKSGDGTLVNTALKS